MLKCLASSGATSKLESASCIGFLINFNHRTSYKGSNLSIFVRVFVVLQLAVL